MQSNSVKALSLPAATLLGLAGNAPAYTIAITCWTLVLASKEYSAAILLWCGLLVMGVAYSYGRLNRMQVSGGAAFTWVSKLVHPKAGFLAGWCLLAASVLFLVSAALPAAKLVIAVLSVTETKSTVLVASGALIILLATFSVNGVVFVGKTQAIFTFLELTTLVVLACVLFVVLNANSGLSAAVPRVSLRGVSVDTLSQGIVIAIFFYWGWDVLFNAAESTRDSANNSKVAGYIVMCALIFLFVVFTGFAQLALTEETMKVADGNVLTALANLTGSPRFNIAVQAAFFVSTVGAIFACFIQFSQTMLAQSKDGYFAEGLAKLSTESGTPIVAIAVQATLAIVVLASSSYSSTVDEILSASIGASAVFVAFYYGFATIACMVNEWHQEASVKTRLVRCLIPALALVALWVCGALVAFSFSTLATKVICVVFGAGILMSFISIRRSPRPAAS